MTRLINTNNQLIDLDQMLKDLFGLNEPLYKQALYLLSIHQNDNDLFDNNRPSWMDDQTQILSNSSEYTKKIATLSNYDDFSTTLYKYRATPGIYNTPFSGGGITFPPGTVSCSNDRCPSQMPTYQTEATNCFSGSDLTGADPVPIPCAPGDIVTAHYASCICACDTPNHPGYWLCSNGEQ